MISTQSETRPDTRASVVVFDIGRVLVQWRIGALYEKLIDDPERLDWFLTHVVSEAWHAQHDAGVPLAAMIAELSARYPAERALIEAYGRRWLETVPGDVAGMHDLVRALAARGVPLYAITNFGADTWALFRPTYPILDHMRDIVVSGHERLIKPDPAIFELAASRFGHEPAEMVFIDDNAANVATARALGWHVHHFLGDAGALASDLRGHGLLD